MSIQLAGTPMAPAPLSASWGAVFALTLCVSTLVASEFMPVSLLTPIASDLHLSEGRAGQAIAVSGLFALLTSLFIASVARSVDRRKLLLGLTGVMLASGFVTARVVDVAQPHAASRRGGWRRPHGRGHSARHHGWRLARRAAVRP